MNHASCPGNLMIKIILWSHLLKDKYRAINHHLATPKCISWVEYIKDINPSIWCGLTVIKEFQSQEKEPNRDTICLVNIQTIAVDIKQMPLGKQYYIVCNVMVTHQFHMLSIPLIKNKMLVWMLNLYMRTADYIWVSFHHCYNKMPKEKKLDLLN